ncbi:hypothetical protein FF098_005985 [Parvularcula flava]|nr:hypothetical protein [Aquisalinus luteolus]NHK27448.1 hypothetical protein [Aquisalinus luteolus]
MQRFCSVLTRFTVDETGTSAIEYTLILTIIGATLVIIFDAIADSSETMWNNIDTDIDEAI